MIKTQSLMIPFPPTRINDRFAREGFKIDFSPSKFDHDPMIQGGPNDLSTRFQANFYKKIGVDIVTETVFDYPYSFFTEKSYRPIACLRPFIILGPYKILDFIRLFEFKTFSAIIDESYDLIEDPEERFHSVCRSIKQFTDRPINQVQKDIASIEPLLIHNHKILQNLVAKELERFKLKI
jgi:hypothetical protein